MSVDIIMATYNGERYLREQIDSIIGQTFSDWRLLVSDDCSMDATLEILREYEQKDSRIRIVSEGKRFGSAMKNFWNLLEHASAPFIMFCDQDDVWRRDKVELSYSAIIDLEKKTGSQTPLLVFTDMRVVDENLNVIAPSFERYRKEENPNIEFARLLVNNHAAGCSLIMNAAVLRAMRVVSEEARQYVRMHDWWAALIAAGLGEIEYIDTPTVDYRQHGDNTVGALRPKRTAFLKPRTEAAFYLSFIRQAAVFERLYGSMMDLRRKKILRSYLDSARGGISGAFSLVKSGSFRTHISEVAFQFVTTCFVYPLFRRKAIEARNVGRSL